MVDFRPLLFINALALMLLVTAGFASIQGTSDPVSPVAGAAQSEAGAKQTPEPADSSLPAGTSSGTERMVSESSKDAPQIDEDAIFADSEDTASEEPGPAPREAHGAQQTNTSNHETSTDTPSLAGKKPDEDTATPETTAPDTFTVTPSGDNDTGADTVLAMAEPAMSGSAGETGATADTAEPIPKPKPKAEPKPTKAQLTLRSNVVGDRVHINGKSYGATRLDLELQPGDYNIKIGKQGFRDWQQSVRLEAGDDITLRGQLDAYTRVNYRNGQWIGGVRTGDGTYEGKDGLQYNGHFVDGKFDGRGTAIYPNGDKYEGRWTQDKPSEGTLRKANGSVYEGAFSNGKYSGQGTLTRANGDVLTGEWSGGELNGHGSLTTEAGKLYVGGFLNGKFHGEGSLTYPNGHTYEGSFSKGEFQGKGSEVFADGKKYVGHYTEGKFHGKGTLMNPNGSSIKATFRYGKPYGQATLTTPEGEVFHARSKEPGVCYRDKSYRATQCPPLEGW